MLSVHEATESLLKKYIFPSSTLISLCKHQDIVGDRERAIRWGRRRLHWPLRKFIRFCGHCSPAANTLSCSTFMDTVCSAGHGKQEHFQALPPSTTPSSGLNPRMASSTLGKEKYPRTGAAEVSRDETLHTVEKCTPPQEDRTSTSHLLYLHPQEGEVIAGLTTSLLSSQPHLSHVHAENATYYVHTATPRYTNKSRDNGCGFGVPDFHRLVTVNYLFFRSLIIPLSPMSSTLPITLFSRCTYFGWCKRCVDIGRVLKKIVAFTRLRSSYVGTLSKSVVEPRVFNEPGMHYLICHTWITYSCWVQNNLGPCWLLNKPCK